MYFSTKPFEIQNIMQTRCFYLNLSNKCTTHKYLYDLSINVRTDDSEKLQNV